VVLPLQVSLDKRLLPNVVVDGNRRNHFAHPIDGNFASSKAPMDHTTHVCRNVTGADQKALTPLDPKL